MITIVTPARKASIDKNQKVSQIDKGENLLSEENNRAKRG
jgi:hypothetical protein